MIDTERRKELLEMQEYYNCLSDDEFEEGRDEYNRWWSSLTVDEIVFLEEENDKHMKFVSTTEKEIIELIHQRDKRSEER